MDFVTSKNEEKILLNVRHCGWKCIIVGFSIFNFQSHNFDHLAILELSVHYEFLYLRDSCHLKYMNNKKEWKMKPEHLTKLLSLQQQIG